MRRYERILVLNNEAEARLLESILTEQEIPHTIVSFHDSAYNSLFQMQRGWGCIEAPSELRGKIEAIYRDISKKD